MEDVERALALGAVLKRIGDFDLSTFEGRLVLQKTVYLMQSYGLYFGYKFSWYVHGPYCPELTREAFKIYPFLNKIPKAKFAKPQIEKRFQDFLCFIKEKKSEPDWLEQLACIDFLSSLNLDAKKEAIIKAVLNHENHFNKKQCEEAWKHLVKYDLIKEKTE